MPNIMTEKQLSDLLFISRITLKKYRDNGMPFIHISGKYVRYDLDDVIAWLKGNGEENKTA